jgi:hypothetical protein
MAALKCSHGANSQIVLANAAHEMDAGLITSKSSRAAGKVRWRATKPC